MKFVSARPFADPDVAARKLVEIANTVEVAQDGRVHIEKINGPMLFQLKATPAEYKAGLDRALANGWLVGCTRAVLSYASRKPARTCSPRNHTSLQDLNATRPRPRLKWAPGLEVARAPAGLGAFRIRKAAHGRLSSAHAPQAHGITSRRRAPLCRGHALLSRDERQQMRRDRSTPDVAVERAFWSAREEAAAYRRASDVPADEGGVVTRYLPEI